MISDALDRLREVLQPMIRPELSDARELALVHRHYSLEDFSAKERADVHEFSTYAGAAAWLADHSETAFEVFVGEQSTKVVVDPGHQDPNVLTVTHGLAPEGELWRNSFGDRLGQARIHDLLNMGEEVVSDSVVREKLRAVATKLEQRGTRTGRSEEDSIGASSLRATSEGITLEVELAESFLVELPIRSPALLTVALLVFPRFLEGDLVLRVIEEIDERIAEAAYVYAERVFAAGRLVVRGEPEFAARVRG
jgi:hypothetical protein